jgi:maltooligosyltrehalose synthase
MGGQVYGLWVVPIADLEAMRDVVHAYDPSAQREALFSGRWLDANNAEFAAMCGWIPAEQSEAIADYLIVDLEEQP